MILDGFEVNDTDCDNEKIYVYTAEEVDEEARKILENYSWIQDDEKSYSRFF